MVSAVKPAKGGVLSLRAGRRARLRTELNAYYARLYGLDRATVMSCATSSTPPT